MPTVDKEAETKPEIPIQEARATQRNVPQRASLDALLGKRKQERELVLVINDEELSFHFKAIGAQEYDKLLAKHPPTMDQRADGAVYNINSFAPALLAKVCDDPELDPDEWDKVWRSPEWGRGELMQIFGTAVQVCNTGLRDVGPIETA